MCLENEHDGASQKQRLTPGHVSHVVTEWVCAWLGLKGTHETPSEELASTYNISDEWLMIIIDGAK